jgi:DNA modification methylase
MNLSDVADFLDESGRLALINDDVIVALKRIPSSSIDMVVTSPPYWTAVEYSENVALSSQSYSTYIDWLGSVWLECLRVLQPNGKMVVNTPVMPIPKSIIDQSPRHLKNISSDVDSWLMNNSEFMRYGLFVWQKQTSKMMFGSYPYPPNIIENNTIEFLNVYVKPGNRRKVSQETKEANKISQYEWLDLTQQTWFMYPADIKRNQSHPAPFPSKLPARFMKMYTFGESSDHAGDIILDPFNGAGTSVCVAKMLRRRAIGIELSTKYHGIAKTRLQHTLWGQNLNWLVGRPNYMTASELDQFRASKTQDAEVLNVDASKEKSERQHKQKTYGRTLEGPSSSQIDLFTRE